LRLVKFWTGLHPIDGTEPLSEVVSHARGQQGHPPLSVQPQLCRARCSPCSWNFLSLPLPPPSRFFFFKEMVPEVSLGTRILTNTSLNGYNFQDVLSRGRRARAFICRPPSLLLPPGSQLPSGKVLKWQKELSGHFCSFFISTTLSRIQNRSHGLRHV
jgi:hypothetical protein